MHIAPKSNGQRQANQSFVSVLGVKRYHYISSELMDLVMEQKLHSVEP